MLRYLLIPLLAFTCLFSNAQDLKKVKQIFQIAEEHMLYNEFDLALPLYLELIESGWENANVYFSVGICYVNTHGQVQQAIPYLEKASVNVSKNFKEGNYKEERAPEEAWFYLAKSYRLEGQFEKAVEAYKKYRSYLPPADVFFLDFVDLQVKTCERAQELMATPIQFTQQEVPFGEEDDNYAGAVSSDEKAVVYTSFQEVRDPYTQEKTWFEIVFYSTSDGTDWKKPKDVTYDIGSDGFYSTCYLSDKGDFMILYHDDFGNGNLYYSELEGRRWSEIKKFSKNISGRGNESHASLTKDGNMMYFVSDREGGIGDKDIYISVKDNKGRWGYPANLGPTINTPFKEETPFISDDGNTLYFASEAHSSMGGYDIFKSTMDEGGNWSEPQNLGYPINTGGDDTFYQPIGDGAIAYMAKYPEGDGPQRIYRIEYPQTERVIEVVVDVPEVEEELDKSLAEDQTGIVTPVVSAPPVVEVQTIIVPSEYDLQGTVSLQDNNELDGSFYIHVAKYDGEVIASLSPDKTTGEFKTKIKPGSYKVTAYGNGYEPAESSIFISETQQTPEVLTFISMVPIAVSTGEYFTIKSVLFDYNSAELNSEAHEEIERLAILMDKNPSLYIEVSGYSDALGSEDYNKRLSMKRARSVVNYIRNKGIGDERFVSKGFGAANFIAINENADGSDSPEGRKLNRRVEMKVIKSNSDKISVENIYVPDELLYKDQLTYTVLLVNSDVVLEPSYFNSSGEAVNNVWMFTTATGYLYTVGQFKEKADALPVMSLVVDAGFPDAEIINSLEYNELIQNSSNFFKSKMQDHDQTVYTIQLVALKNPKESNAFASLNEVDVVKGEDGYYRYIWGEFIGKTSARQALDEVMGKGYYDAFIVDINKFKN